MNKLLIIGSSFFFPFVIFSSQKSCKKEKVVVNCPKGLEGLWEGTYQTDQVSHQPLFGAFTFYSNGSLLYKGVGNPPAQAIVYSQGRWSLSNNVLSFVDTTVNYTSLVIQSGTFHYDSVHNRLTNGIWHNVTGDDGQFYTGKFPTMDKE